MRAAAPRIRRLARRDRLDRPADLRPKRGLLHLRAGRTGGTVHPRHARGQARGQAGHAEHEHRLRALDGAGAHLPRGRRRPADGAGDDRASQRGPDAAVARVQRPGDIQRPGLRDEGLQIRESVHRHADVLLPQRPGAPGLGGLPVDGPVPVHPEASQPEWGLDRSPRRPAGRAAATSRRGSGWEAACPFWNLPAWTAARTTP